MSINEMLKILLQFSDVGISVLGVVIALASVIAAFRAGVLRSIKLGSLEIKGNEKDVQEAREIIRTVTAPDSTKKVPFETEQLANYYAQVLAQSKTSFWFSLIFASIGFLIIALLLTLAIKTGEVGDEEVSALAA